MSVQTAEAAARGSHRYQLDTGLARLTPAERAARGKEARAEVPRDSHAVFDPRAGPARPDRPAGGAGRDAGAGAGPGPVGPDDGLPVHLLPRRGAADGQRPGHDPGDRAGRCRRAGTRTCRTSASSARAERRLVFDVNDFDETLPGPWEWDVKRLAASLEVAGRRQRVHRQGPRDDRHGHRGQLPAGDAELRRR